MQVTAYQLNLLLGVGIALFASFASASDLTFGDIQLQEVDAESEHEVVALYPWERLPHFRHGETNENGRHVGLGDPLNGTSWQNRPFHVGWLVGCVFGDELTRGQAVQHEDLIGGYRAGWDFDYYWGTEARFAFSNVDFTNVANPTVSSTAQNHFADISLLYYPWGDSRWRPFASLGLGAASFEYADASSQTIDKSLFAIPFGGGVKYYFKNWMALRISAVDNWAIGQGPLNTMHNISLTCDIEVHFGGRRTSYFPYNGSNHLW